MALIFLDIISLNLLQRMISVILHCKFGKEESHLKDRIISV